MTYSQLRLIFSTYENLVRSVALYLGIRNMHHAPIENVEVRTHNTSKVTKACMPVYQYAEHSSASGTNWAIKRRKFISPGLHSSIRMAVYTGAAHICTVRKQLQT